MGRPPLSREAAREVTIRLIRTAQSLMVNSGVENVTIRMIAAEAGLNSAVLYKYFEDLDELLMFACVDLLKSYCSELLSRESEMENATAKERYMMTWSVFCRYAFEQPDFMLHLFFSRHSDMIDRVISGYYDLFPEQLEGMSEELSMMLRRGSLRQRNMEVLRPVLAGAASDERIDMINDLTVGYFFALLSERSNDHIGAPVKADKMLEACRLLIEMGADL